MFSETVDDLVLRARTAPRQFTSVVAAVNAATQTLAKLRFFSRDMLEDSILLTDLTVNEYIWTLPFRFRRLATAQYIPNERFPEEAVPGRVNKSKDFVWYRTSTYIAFKGVLNQTSISVHYARFPRHFVYFAAGDRPATFDKETETYSYLEPFDVDDTTRANALDLTTHWLLEHYKEAVLEMAFADLRKDSGHPTSRSLFAKSNEYRQTIIDEEPYVTIGDQAYGFDG